MKLLFTRSTKPLSRLIQWASGEPVSHVALQLGAYVVHSTGHGVSIWTQARFYREYTVALTLETSEELVDPDDGIARMDGRKYDTGALVYFGLAKVWQRLTGRALQRNRWAKNGYVMCTEFVTTILEGQERSTVTPYQLYLEYRTRAGWVEA